MVVQDRAASWSVKNRMLVASAGLPLDLDAGGPGGSKSENHNMRAILSKSPGPAETLVTEDVPALEPGDSEVVIGVEACGVNFPDLLIIEDKYQFRPARPFSPGGEVAGIVLKTGPAVTKVQPGDRVIGLHAWGGYAEQFRTDQSRVFKIPDAMEYQTAAAFLLTYATSYHALKNRAELQPGESLLVLGAAGGAGLSAVELGKAMGAKVIAAASSEDKVAIAKEHGADEGLVYPRGALDRDQQKAFSAQIKDVVGPGGVDVIYDPVGGDYSEPALRTMAWKGRFLVVGFASGPIPRIPLNLTLLKGCSIVGVFWGQFAALEADKEDENVRELMEMYLSGKIAPHISATFPFSQVADALREISERKVTGKIVLLPGED